jgi:hypothetical protein
MADEQTATTQPEGGETPQTPAAPTSQAPAEEPFDRDRAMRTIETLREQEKAAKRLQRELEQAQARLKAIDEEKLSETERLTRQKAELEAALEAERARGRDLAIRAAIEREAHKQGAVDVEIVLAVVDRRAIEVDEDGQVKGAGKAVKDLLEAKPLLRDGAPYSGAIPNTPRPSGQTLTRDQQIEQAQKELQAGGRYRV